MKNSSKPINFIENKIKSDLENGVVKRVITRFPPEPNGFLHIGHAKSICLNFGLADKYGGDCNLRFDDTNPEAEDQRFVDAIIKDVEWLGFKQNIRPKYASDYFDQLYEWAIFLISEGKAYVCELNAEQIREYRGTLKLPGRNSPYRERLVEENLSLFEKMKNGEIPEGAMTLRAKIDMTSGNINLRDPVMYRIKKSSHQRTGDKWCIYPSYDYAHGQEDAIEKITHSICTLEFASNRPLYDWFISNLPVHAEPKQYEFGRLNLNYTITSKRKLKQLVDENYVHGWDDPRMPTISGMRRRGISPAAIRNFCNSLAVAKTDGIVDMAQFEYFVRDDLNNNSPRAMCVFDPIQLTVVNYDEAKLDQIKIQNHPNRPDLGYRETKFGKTLFIEKSDFSDDETLSRKKFKRLVINDYVRLRGSFILKAEKIIKDEHGAITEVLVSIIPNTIGADAPEGIRPRGVIHWVDQDSSVDCSVNLYDRLFNVPSPDSEKDNFLQHFNTESLIVITGCKAEGFLQKSAPGEVFQFERQGYFTRDLAESDLLTFNRSISLRDSWVSKL
ncbi:MAG: glutamine--tRNA ligase/YqeY domain fusion protein [SAR92 clade bacterium]|uniref:Glutamine--tRNA ligase n=1 Tax=SAR92 clade bacterium TaxID=2315479 RepID=A0A520LLG9_9GAMM|nr:MAG: glutamine--tRNA ligase/YqeY domain fusion protein [SAR92 clade bacterium]